MNEIQKFLLIVASIVLVYILLMKGLIMFHKHKYKKGNEDVALAEFSHSIERRPRYTNITGDLYIEDEVEINGNTEIRFGTQYDYLLMYNPTEDNFTIMRGTTCLKLR